MGAVIVYFAVMVTGMTVVLGMTIGVLAELTQHPRK